MIYADVITLLLYFLKDINSVCTPIDKEDGIAQVDLWLDMLKINNNTQECVYVPDMWMIVVKDIRRMPMTFAIIK